MAAMEESSDVSNVLGTIQHGGKRSSACTADRIFDLTNNYRWKVLNLSETSPTEIAWLTSQHMLDQLWQTSHRDKSSDISTATTPPKNNTSKLVHYACQECGFLLHPGWRGTRIRSSGREDLNSQSVRKTMRRREQRKRQQAARTKQMKAKVGSVSQPSSSSSKQTTTAGDKSRTLLLLESSPKINLLDRNHLVLSCGRCHAKYYLKGPGENVATKVTRTTAVAIKNVSSQQPITSEGTRDAAWGDDLDGNFVVLPKSNNKIKDMSSERSNKPTSVRSSLPTAIASISALSSPQLTLLERRQQEIFGNKKKKPKKNAPPKNELLNFLSSLNDP